MPDPAAEMIWKARPVSNAQGRGLFVIALILILSIAVAFWMKSPYWGIFGFLVLFLSLESFFFATTYRLGEDGVEVRKRFSKSFRGWDTFRSVYVDRRGVTLSPYDGRAFMEPYRASRIIFAGNREAVLECIRSRIGSEVQIVETS